MSENPYESPKELCTRSEPPRDYSFVSSIVAFLLVMGVIGLLLLFLPAVQMHR